MKTGDYLSLLILIGGCTFLIMDQEDFHFNKIEKQIQNINTHVESKDSIHFACVKCGWSNRLATEDTTGLIRTKKRHK